MCTGCVRSLSLYFVIGSDSFDIVRNQYSNWKWLLLHPWFLVVIQKNEP